MASTPDHMRGFDSIPRWDPSNPDKYNYDPKVPYDRADYARFNQARAQRDKQRVAKGKAELKKVMQDVAQTIHEKISDELKQPRRNRPLEWDGESSCFASLEYDDEAGGVWATFNRGGQTPAPYFYEMSRAEAREFFDDPSVGAFFNAEIRE